MQISRELLKACLENDRRAQNELYREVFNFLMNICMRYKTNYDDAGAALNGIFLKMLDGLTEFDLSKPVGPWLKTIAIRSLIDEHRASLRHQGEELNGHQGAHQINGHSRLQEKDILSLIQSLSEPTRTVINLYIIDGYKHKEISEMLDMSEGNSRWHLNKGRNFIKQYLEREEKILDKVIQSNE